MSLQYMTQEGLDKLKKELAEAIAQRPVISAAIAEARDKGDLSENAEYDAAKDEQAMIEGEILEIKVSSTDVPLRLRIRDKATNNEASWLDDGTHVFRIRLKDKKQLTKELMDKYKYIPEVTEYLDGKVSEFKKGNFDLLDLYSIILWKINRFPTKDGHILEEDTLSIINAAIE